MSDVPVMVATDLDRTLIFSPRATSKLGGELPRSVVETVEGRVISELSDVVRDGLRALAALPSSVVTVVPTTTRTPRQLYRVELPFTPRYAIASSGGVVLDGGVADPQWADLTRRRLSGAAPAGQVRAVLDALVRDGVALRAYTAEDQFCYVVVNPQVFGEEQRLALVAELTGSSWRVAHQGTKVYLLPDALHKAHAVDYVRDRLSEQLGARPTLLAAGDTWLDAEMLAAADSALVPARSEIVNTGPLPWPHAAVTAEAGHAGAAEIVGAWLQAALATAAA